MLQTPEIERLLLQTPAIEYGTEDRPVGFGRFLSPRYYLGVVKRRLLHFLVPVTLIAPAGVAVVMLLPAIYLSQGKILVESQRIPTELVRPTVTSLAAERIQVMEQRLMTRDNIMAIIDKFKLFADRRNVLSTTELVDLVRSRTHIKPIEFAQRRSPNDRVTMAFTIGFEHEQPDIAAKVAGELVTLILNEDLRNRTGRASETTTFLAREVNRLQGELIAVEAQVVEAKRALDGRAQAALERRQASLAQTTAQLAKLKAERVAKANQLSWNHPEVQSLHGRISALERTLAPPVSNQTQESDVGLKSLEKRQEGVRKSLEDASAKLAAARMGEALERDQQAEKLEVIEQPAQPQEPIKPKRMKLLGVVLALALFAGAGLAIATEALDSTIRGRGDLAGLVESRLIVTLPYIETRRDRIWRKLRILRTFAILLAVLSAAGVAAYLFLPPLDLLRDQMLIKLPRYLNR